MDEKKYTLDDIFGDRESDSLIELHLWESDLEIMMTFFGKMESAFTAMTPKDERYKFMRAFCLIDIEIHKQGITDCQVGSPECGLLNTLNAFANKFKDEIEHDDKYKLSDFQWDNKHHNGS